MIRLKLQPQLNEYITYFIQNGFIKLSTLNENLQRIVYGPLGEILFENIRKEWNYANSTYREHNVFPYHSRSFDDFVPDIKEAFSIGKDLNGNCLPFGLIDSRKNEFANRIGEPLLPKHGICLRYHGFYHPDEGKQFFYQWTQQRKRWWRKFASDPGKFSMSEIDRNESLNTEQVNILVNFPWGVHNVESVKFLNTAPFKNDRFNKNRSLNIMQFESEGKNYFPHVIESVCSLDYAAITYMLDSYDIESKICRFHRKLAPYKFAFASPPVDDKLSLELFEMSQMLCFDVMKSGLNCLIPVKTRFGKESIEKQLDRYNSIGVPYTAILTDKTLNTGIFGLYSRETTLQEDIHIEKFKEYGVLLMKNY